MRAVRFYCKESNMGRWIWHFGDFEMSHNLRRHMRRDKFGYQFPPFWRLDDCYHNVVFRKEADEAEVGFIRVNACYEGMRKTDGSAIWMGDAVTYPICAGYQVIGAKVMRTGVLPRWHQAGPLGVAG